MDGRRRHHLPDRASAAARPRSGPPTVPVVIGTDAPIDEVRRGRGPHDDEADHQQQTGQRRHDPTGATGPCPSSSAEDASTAGSVNDGGAAGPRIRGVRSAGDRSASRPSVGDSPPRRAADRDTPGGRRPDRASAVIVAVALVGLAALVLWRLAGPAPGPPTAAAHRASRRWPTAAGLVHAYEGDFTVRRRWRRGHVRLRRRRTAGPVPRRRRGSGGAVPQREPGRRRSPVRAQSPIRSPICAAVTGAYPLDIDGDRRIDLVVLRLGENVDPARHSATAGSSAPTRPSASTAATAGPPPSARRGRRPTPRCRRWRSATTWSSTTRAWRPTVRRRRAHPSRRRRA